MSREIVQYCTVLEIFLEFIWRRQPGNPVDIALRQQPRCLDLAALAEIVYKFSVALVSFGNEEAI